MSRKKIRQKKVRIRKYSIPIIAVTILLWAGLGFLIYFVDPFARGALVGFFVMIFLALFSTFAALLLNTRRGLIVAASITSFLILRYLGIGHYLNLLLILGIAITVEYYFWRK